MGGFSVLFYPRFVPFFLARVAGSVHSRVAAVHDLQQLALFAGVNRERLEARPTDRHSLGDKSQRLAARAVSPAILWRSDPAIAVLYTVGSALSPF